jgi:hypothetical protein
MAEDCFTRKPRARKDTPNHPGNPQRLTSKYTALFLPWELLPTQGTGEAEAYMDNYGFEWIRCYSINFQHWPAPPWGSPHGYGEPGISPPAPPGRPAIARFVGLRPAKGWLITPSALAG